MRFGLILLILYLATSISCLIISLGYYSYLIRKIKQLSNNSKIKATYSSLIIVSFLPFINILMPIAILSRSEEDEKKMIEIMLNLVKKQE